MKTLKAIVALAALTAGATALAADRPFITVASTTSTQNSGLFKELLPKFTAATGIDVHVVAVGTGQAIKLASNGDADVLLVHYKPAEEKFIAAGNGVKRFDLMYNDFVLVGPTTDPAGVADTSDIVRALQKVAAAKATFCSRGDDSGTHKKERALWKAAGIDPTGASGGWYRETGSGMGATLNTAAGMNAYALTDRGTWLNFANRGNLRVVVQNDPQLYNQYGVTLVNPAKFPHVKKAEGQKFVDWLLSPAGQKAIADYRIGGEQAFFPNAKPGA